MAQVVGFQLLCWVIVPCRNGGDYSTQVKMLVIPIRQPCYVCQPQFQAAVCPWNEFLSLLFAHFPKWSNGACLLGPSSQSCRLRARVKFVEGA